MGGASDAGVGTLFLKKLNEYLDGDNNDLPSILRKDLEGLRVYMKEVVANFKNAKTQRNSRIADARKIIYGAEDKLDKIMVTIRSTKKWGVVPILPIPYALSISSRGNVKKQLDAVGLLLLSSNESDKEGGEAEATSRPLQKNGDDDDEEEEEGSFEGVHKPWAECYYDEAVGGVGPDEIKEELQRLLLLNNSCQLNAVFVTGIEGIGKTFLVRNVWDKREVQSRFYNRAWISDASSLEPKAILRSILDEFCYGTAPYAVSSMDVESLVQTTHSHLRGRNFLLVLDDVQDIKVWKLVSPALPLDSGGRVILTTRKSGLTSSSSFSGIPCHHLPVGRLSDKQAWEVFCVNAPGYENYDETRKILEECGSVPLSIVTIATILSDPHGYYHPNALTNFRKRLKDNRGSNRARAGRDRRITGGHASVRARRDVKRTHGRPAPVPAPALVQAQVADVEITPAPATATATATATALVLSCNELGFQLKYVFLYCCFFPNTSGREIQVRKLIRSCVAEGFVEEEQTTAEETMAKCLKQLIKLKLINTLRTRYSGSPETISVSKTMRDLASDIVKKEMFREFCSYTDDTTIPVENVRRLFITENSNIPANKCEVSFVRSCFVSDIDNSKSSSVCPLLVAGLRLLRVLDLKGMKVTDELLHHLGDLIHLRYLGLRATTTKVLPASLSNLHNLQTLDTRETQESYLPVEMMRHGKFRHVLLAGSFSRKVVDFPWESKNVRSLHMQTLAGVRASITLFDELQHWTRLQKLSIGGVRSHDFRKLCAAIKYMRVLRSLTTKAYRVEKLPMGELPWGINSNLDTLKIGGPMDSLRNGVHCFISLSRLYLWDSILDEDPFFSLKGLSGLVVLCLSNASKKKHMICDMGWFPKMKKLSVLRMKHLEHLEIMKRNISSLDNLFIGYCPNLKVTPRCIEDLGALQVVQVSQMPQNFVNALQVKSKIHLGHFRVHIIPQFVHAE